jgi:hypothetical protein
MIIHPFIPGGSDHLQRSSRDNSNPGTPRDGPFSPRDTSFITRTPSPTEIHGSGHGSGPGSGRGSSHGSGMGSGHGSGLGTVKTHRRTNSGSSIESTGSDSKYSLPQIIQSLSGKINDSSSIDHIRYFFFTYIYVYMNICIYIYMYTYAYIYIDIYKCVHICMYIYMYII